MRQATKRLAGGGFRLSTFARLRKLPKYIADPSVSMLKKGGVILGLVYLFSPVDAIPDLMPIVGLLDDLGLLTGIYLFLGRELDKYAGK